MRATVRGAHAGKPHNAGQGPGPGPFWLETQEGMPRKATDPDFFQIMTNSGFGSSESIATSPTKVLCSSTILSPRCR